MALLNDWRFWQRPPQPQRPPVGITGLGFGVNPQPLNQPHKIVPIKSKQPTYGAGGTRTDMSAVQEQALKEGRLAEPQSIGQAIIGLADPRKLNMAGGNQGFTNWKTPGIDYQLLPKSVPIIGGKKRIDLKGIADVGLSIAADPSTYLTGPGKRAVQKGVTDIAKAAPSARELALGEVGAVGKNVNKAAKLAPKPLPDALQSVRKPVADVGSTIPPVKPPSPPVATGAIPEPRDPLAMIEESLRTNKPPLRDKITAGRDRFMSEYVDRNNALYGLENQTGVPTHQMAQLVSGATAAGEDILRKTVRPVLKGLSADDIANLEKYMVIKRGQDIATLHPNTQLPGGVAVNELTIAENQLRTKLGVNFAKIDSAAQALWKINDEQVLKPLLNEGIISPESYAGLKAAHPHYIDFHRADYSLVDNVGHAMSRPESSVSSIGIQKLNPLGSDLKLDQPLARSETQIIRTQNLISRNRAAKTIVEGLTTLEQQTGQKLVKVLKPSEAAVHSITTDTISFFRDGIKQTVQVPREYAVAAKNMDAELTNGFTNFVSKVNAPFRSAVTTYNPSFIIINPMRDAISAWYKERLIPLSSDYIHGWIAAIAKNSDFSEAAKSGALMSGIVETQRSTSKLAQQATRGALSVRNAKDVLTIIPRLLSEANMASERATHIATFIKLRNKGVDSLAAAVRARDVTVDFAKSGNTMRLINQVIPFSNASLQGAVNTLSVMKKNPKWALAATAPLGAATVLAFINNKRFESSDKIPEYEYNYSWVFQLGEGKDNKSGETFPIYVKVPKGPQGALLAAPVEMALRMAWKNNDRSVLEEFLYTGKNMATALSPIEPTISGILPAALGTGVSLATNKDLFRNTPIVPQGEQARLPEQQFGADTSTTAVQLGQAFKVSPRLIDFALKDYLGGAGQAVNWVADMAVEALAGRPEMYNQASYSPPTGMQQTTKLPVLGRFVGAKDTGTSSQQWENLNSTITDTNRSFSQLPDMNRLGIRLGEAPTDIGQLALTPKERIEYQSAMADTVIAGLRGFVPTGTDAERKKAIQNEIAALKEQAKVDYLTSPSFTNGVDETPARTQQRKDLVRVGEYLSITDSITSSGARSTIRNAMKYYDPGLDVALRLNGYVAADKDLKTPAAQALVTSRRSGNTEDLPTVMTPERVDRLRKIIEPYYGIDPYVWNLYPPQVKAMADQIKLWESGTDYEKAKAKSMLRSNPSILRARELIANYKLRMRRNKELDFYIRSYG